MPRVPKTCVICMKDCAGSPRVKDRRGRHYHRACFQKMRRELLPVKDGAKRDPVKSVPIVEMINGMVSSPAEPDQVHHVEVATAPRRFLGAENQRPLSCEKLSDSPYGTLDQGGNVYEWNEAINLYAPFRGVRGGSFGNGGKSLHAANRGSSPLTYEAYILGFRVAEVP